MAGNIAAKLPTLGHEPGPNPAHTGKAVGQRSKDFMRGAFRGYRDFDGKGAHFGDTSLSVTTSDTAASPTYASLKVADPSQVVIVAINQRSNSLAAAVRIAHTNVYSRADVYALTSTKPEVAAASGITAGATNTFLYTMRAQSVSVRVLTT